MLSIDFPIKKQLYHLELNFLILVALILATPNVIYVIEIKILEILENIIKNSLQLMAQLSENIFHISHDRPSNQNLTFPYQYSHFLCLKNYLNRTSEIINQ